MSKPVSKKPAQKIRGISLVETQDRPFYFFSREADIDYILARQICFLGPVFKGRTGFFAHMACEKYLKAILVQETRAYLETHKLLELAKECSKFYPLFAEKRTLSSLEIFDSFDQVGRYGGAANFDPYAKKNEAFETAGVMVWPPEALENLDYFVFYCRKLLDFSKINQQDWFASLLQNRPENILRKTWGGRPNALVTLTRSNKYFKRVSKGK